MDRLDLRLAGVRSVIWATGYRMDLGWIEGIRQDAEGYPLHERGVTPWPGLYFVGLPWLHTRGSSFIPGVGPDAAFVVEHIAERSKPRPAETVAGSLGGAGRSLRG